MEIGTAEPVIDPEEEELRPKSSRLRGGGGPSGGRDDGGGGGGAGGDDPNRFRFDPSETDQRPDKSKFVTWFLLLVVLMTFGGLIGAYIVISTNGAAEWRPFNLPIQVWLSTTLIIASSITYELGRRALFAERFATSRKMWIATTALGAAFISSQILVWLALVKQGMYMRGNPYAGFFYILTAVHAIHVLGGIVALGAVMLRTWNESRLGAENEYRERLARSVGWYWHFMGGLWIVLFALLGFWK